ncbi:hypothetical protein [uncultured Pseudodesulfovibrio sp.]|uniref:hypothetical protein n=1 Tax=uncultured Pseudodesulfovibrio sp. TaxID=2035858 RepID=UPI0029C98FD4|nr:hypothetical protein [uncultured Pseudodesulfovibrio sp.]
MGEYLHVTVRGTLSTADEVINDGSIYYEVFEQTGIKRALMDFREASFNLSCYEMVQFAKFLQNTKFTYQRPKVAQLTTPQEKKKFDDFNTVATNRGHFPKVFTDKEAALAWLLSS